MKNPWFAETQRVPKLSVLATYWYRLEQDPEPVIGQHHVLLHAAVCVFCLDMIDVPSSTWLLLIDLLFAVGLAALQHQAISFLKLDCTF